MPQPFRKSKPAAEKAARFTIHLFASFHKLYHLACSVFSIQYSVFKLNIYFAYFWVCIFFSSIFFLAWYV